MHRTTMAVLVVALIGFLGTPLNHNPPRRFSGPLPRQRSSAKSGILCLTPTRTIGRWRRRESVWQVGPTQAEKIKLHQQHQLWGSSM